MLSSFFALDYTANTKWNLNYPGDFNIFECLS